MKPLAKVLVLLDAVGTIIHPVPHPSRIYFEAGRRHGSRLNARTVERRIRRLRNEVFESPSGLLSDHQLASVQCVTDDDNERQQWRHLVERLFDDVDSIGPLFDELWAHFGDPTHWRLHDDVATTMAALRSQGATIGIASNFDHRLLAICRGLPPLDSIEAVYPSSAIGYCKPDERFYRAIERDWSGPIIMAGDDPVHDWQAPRRIGWTAFWLDRHGHSVDDSVLQASRIESLNELVHRIGERNDLGP